MKRELRRQGFTLHAEVIFPVYDSDDILEVCTFKREGFLNIQIIKCSFVARAIKDFDFGLKYCESNGYVKNNPLSFYKYEEWIYSLHYNENFNWVNSCIFKIDNWGATYGWGTQRRFYTSIANYFKAEFGIDVLEFRKQVNAEGYYVYTPEYNQYLLEHSGTILNLENILRANDYDNSVEAMYDRLE